RTSRHFSPPRIPVSQSCTRATRSPERSGAGVAAVASDLARLLAPWTAGEASRPRMLASMPASSIDLDLAQIRTSVQVGPSAAGPALTPARITRLLADHHLVEG